MRATALRPLVCCALAAVLAGCGSEDTAVRLPARDADLPADWVEHETDAFVFTGPPDLVDQELRGIDSLVGHWVGAELELTFDHGFYSDRSFAGRRDRPGQVIEGLALGSHPAELTCWDDDDVADGRPLACSVFAPDVGPEESPLPMDVRLQFTVRFADPALRPAVRALLRSIRFRD